MLEQAGIKSAARKPSLDEEEVKRHFAGLGPEDMAMRLAEAKALSLSSSHDHAIVIGADQVLDFDGHRIDKPASLQEARKQLMALRGRTHRLISAVACARRGGIIWSHTGTAELEMRPFSEGFLDDYLARTAGEATQSVGAYKLEALGAQLFETIRGDYFTILGLPLLPLMSFLRSTGELPS
jgi:septum formation protein